MNKIDKKPMLSPNDLVYIVGCFICSIITILLISFKDDIKSPLVWILIGVNFGAFAIFFIVFYCFNRYIKNKSTKKAK